MAKRKMSFARVTISVSSTVRSAMKKRKDLNWSKLAERAFQAALDNPQVNISTTVERLRASRAASQGLEYHRGKAAGSAWASTEAEFDELQRLERLINDDRFNKDSIDDVSDGVLGETGQFWQIQFGGETPSPKTIKGFWEGALEVFQSVKSQL